MDNPALRIPMLKRRAWWPVPLLVVLSAPVFFLNLGNYGMVNGDEGFFQHTAYNMVRSGDWLTIQWMGELRVYETFLGSPFQVWARAAIIYVAGDNYWTMRVISATCGMLAVLLTYRLGRQFMTSAESLLAALLLMFTYHFVFLHGARTGEMDAILTLLLVWIVYRFMRALRENRSFVPHHLGVILLISVKLPVVTVVVVLEAAFFVLMPKHRQHIKRWIQTMLWICPLGMVWHIYQFIEIGPKAVFEVFELMAAQAAGTRGAETTTGETALWTRAIERASFYGPVLLFGAFPYILFVPLALVGVWRHHASRRSREYLLIITL
ncbi:MAG: glycosyltransferase family 39 protein, partial [Planctomycetes bacterium]|nr:glycosyltransferase family 39 protein [Planctomycetota bacterium]